MESNSLCEKIPIRKYGICVKAVTATTPTRKKNPKVFYFYIICNTKYKGKSCLSQYTNTYSHMSFHVYKYMYIHKIDKYPYTKYIHIEHWHTYYEDSLVVLNCKNHYTCYAPSIEIIMNENINVMTSSSNGPITDDIHSKICITLTAAPNFAIGFFSTLCSRRSKFAIWLPTRIWWCDVSRMLFQPLSQYYINLFIFSLCGLKFVYGNIATIQWGESLHIFFCYWGAIHRMDTRLLVLVEHALLTITVSVPWFTESVELS